MYSRILVPLDGSATAERGLQEAIRLCSGTGAEVRLLHVIDAYALIVELAAVASLEELLAQAHKHGDEVLSAARARAAACGIQASTTVIEMPHGRVSDAILDEARKGGCDLIVMGSHGRRNALRMTLGSCAEQVLRASNLPVLLIRAADVPSLERDF